MRYATPASAKEAAGMLSKEKGAAFLLAGGTDLLVKLKMGMVEPDLVVDIKRIPKIDQIQTSAKGFVIGAAVSGSMIGQHKGLRAAWPGVVEAANLIGSDQIQGRATLVGNLCNASPAADSVPAMIAAGEKEIAEICIVADSPSPVSPCGGCRQKLAEFSKPSTSVLFAVLCPVRSGWAMWRAWRLPLPRAGRELYSGCGSVPCSEWPPSSTPVRWQ